MPNHIQNRLEIIGTKQKVQEVKEFMIGKPYDDGTERIFDFNKLIPMPEELDIEISSWGDMGQAILFGKGRSMFLGIEEIWRRFDRYTRKQQKEILEMGFKYQDNANQFGHATWYPWAKENWGTKWNAYSSSYEEENVIMFQTAWNGVPNLIKKLSQRFPNVEFIYEWADEDTGSNCAMYRYINGEAIESAIPESQSIEAYELAFKLWPGDKEMYKLVDGKYEYDEEREFAD